VANQYYYPDINEGTNEARYGWLIPLLLKANRTCELLHKISPDNELGVTTYGGILDVKARIHDDSGQPALALATFRQAEEFFAAAERKGLVNAHGHDIWRKMISSAAFAYFSAHQLETAKRYFLRALAMPELGAIGGVNVMPCMARYHKERREWVEMTMCLQEALTLLPKF